MCPNNKKVCNVKFYSMQQKCLMIYIFSTLGTVMTGLQGVASYMVDVTVPSRERRHAIQPSTNPITRSFRRKRKGGKKSCYSTICFSTNEVLFI